MLGKRVKSTAKHLGMLGAVLAMSSTAELSAQSDPTLIGAGQRPFVIMVVDSSASMDFSLEGEQKFPCHDNTDASGNSISCDAGAGIGGNQPPANQSNYPNVLDSYPSLFEWRSGSELGDSNNEPLDESLPWNEKDYENPLVGPLYVGPCMVWKDACEDYSRPPWAPEMLDPGAGVVAGAHNSNSLEQYDSRMWERLRAMRGTVAGFTVKGPGQLPGLPPSRRLRDDNQPRHVQVKEILTGDMILRPGDALADSTIPLNPTLYGPGCWFVPRMSGVPSNKTQWHACAELEFSGNSAKQRSCATNADCMVGTTCRQVELGSSICVRDGGNNHTNSFYRMVDRGEPRPHIQEVYDRQLQTGIMDNLANTAIFAVAMFDGSQGKIQGPITNATSPVQEPNSMDNSQPLINDGIPDDIAGTYPPEGPTNYDLGVYKIIGPTQLDVPSSQLPSLSSFTQYAVQDAGYLRNFRNDSDAEKWRIDPSNSSASRLEYNFSSGLDKYIQPYQMGQQPMSGATPLAAAMRDIHMYMRNGQNEFNFSGQAEAANSGTYDPTQKDAIKDLNKPNQRYIVNPVEQDPYRRCRAKHVVLMTDGFPEPERATPPPVDIKVGSDRLSPLFGYPDAANRYPYETAENEILDLVEDMHLTDVEGDNPLFKPRVHVVGLNLLGAQACTSDADCAGSGSDLSCAQINGRQLCAVDNNNNDVPDRPEKLGRMAAAGKTCAQWQLVQGDGKKYVPSTWPAIGGQSGTCDPTSDNCLVRQLSDGDSIPFMNNEGNTVNCIAPALILEQNDRFQDESMGNRPFRDDLTEALQLVFNQVLNDAGGVASRTRVTIINSLDDSDLRGQYRTFSGVDVQGSSVYWKGLLERQTLSCQAAGSAIGGVTSKSLSDEIDGQVRVNLTNPSGYEDNRRIFTSSSLKQADGSLLTTSASTGDVIFHAHELNSYLTPTSDEFQNTRFTGGDRLNALVRVPFEVDALLEKLGVTSIASAVTTDFLRILNAEDEAVARETVNVVRGRISKKSGRVMGAILNSNPISVGPPSRDVQIGSYRAYREKYGTRTSMLYVATLDGLLHAVHTGEGEDASELGVLYSGVNGSNSPTSGDEGTATKTVYVNADDTQREAWAYAPEMLKNQYSRVRDVQPNLMDGTPVVSDVRLCNGRSSANQNKQACKAAEQGGNVSGEDQWRTVLVQGLGLAGAGYFALDVTHTGGPNFTNEDKRPDPIPLWEFDWDWEQRQILALKTNGKIGRYGYSTGVTNSAPSLDSSTSCDEAQTSIDFNGSDVDQIEDLPFMGLSVGDPAIGTVVLTGVDSSDNSRRVQRPVAIFSAGLNGELKGPSGFGAEPNDCLAEERRGRAIYVVDLQTGTLLRRFLDYSDRDTGTSYRFQAEVAGTPAMYDNRVGVVSNRAFVGDVAGRLFRVDLSNSDPEDWEVELMFDPCDDAELKTSAGVSCVPFAGNADIVTDPRPFGPSSFEPSVALDANRRVTVVYGLGERTDTSVADQVQAMVAIREREPSETNHEVSWFTTFEPESSLFREKLTGPPTIFNFGVYFTTFVENKDNVCEPGLTRIWGLSLMGDGVAGSKATGGALDFTADGSTFSSADIKFSDDPTAGLVEWYEPQEPMLVRGVTVAFPPDCSENITDPSNLGLADNPESEQSMPELVATTSNPMTTAGDTYAPNQQSDLMAGGAGQLGFQVKRLKPPLSQLNVLSWAVVGQ